MPHGGGGHGGGGRHGGGGHSGGGGHGGGGHSGGGGHGGGFRGGYGGYGWHRGPRGCGLTALIKLLVIIIGFSVCLLFRTMDVYELLHGGNVEYSESKMQKYCDEQYRAVYGDSSAYEDNVLLVFLTYDDRTQFDVYSWVGDHLERGVQRVFENRTLSLAEKNINSPYTHSLNTGLSRLVDDMTDAVAGKGLSSNFTCGETHVQRDNAVINRSEISLDDAAQLQKSLDNFTEKTGISITVVVEDGADVFGRSFPIVRVIIIIGIVGLAVFIIIRIVRSRRNKYDGDDYNSYDNDYSDDNQYDSYNWKNSYDNDDSDDNQYDSYNWKNL